jgi:hypothetical protein
MTNKTDKHLATSNKRKREMTQIYKIRNKKQDITTNTNKFLIIISEYSKNL